MKSILTHFLLAATLTTPLFAHANLDSKSRREMIDGTRQETRKFIALLSAVNKNCSAAKAKQVAGSVLNLIDTDILGLSKYAKDKPTPACSKATADFKSHTSLLLKNNKRLLFELIKSASLSSEANQDDACAELPLKKSRYAFANTHRVTQMRPNEYLAQVSINFVASPGVDKSAEANMRQRATQCVAQAGYMQDHQGHKIKLQIEKPGTAQAKNLTTFDVGISKNIRSNSLNYDINIDCSAILHEVLHLLGLHDEYSEKGYTCRATAQSIMGSNFKYSLTKYGVLEIPPILKDTGRPGANPLELVFAARPNEIEFSKVDSIECLDPNSKSYKALGYSIDNELLFSESDGYYVRSSEPRSQYAIYMPTVEVEAAPLAPRSYINKFMKLAPNSNWDCRIATDAAKTKIKGSDMLTKSTFPLRPAHFRKIVYPACIQKNLNYDTCTSEDYLLNPASSYQCVTSKHKVCQNERFLD